MNSQSTIHIRWYHKALLLGLSAVILAILLEGAGRLLGALPPKADAEYRAISRQVGKLSTPHDSFVFSGGSGNQVEFEVPIRLNRLGFRTDDLPAPAPDDNTRIVLLGDSFTSDWQVPEGDMWSSWLERELRASGVRNEIVNLGHPGWGTTQEYLLYRAYGDTLDADLVVLAIYVENDVADNGSGMWDEYEWVRDNFTYFTLDDTHQLVEHPWSYVDVTRPYLYQQFPTNIIGWLDKNSVIYRALRNAVDAVFSPGTAPDATSWEAHRAGSSVAAERDIPLEMEAMDVTADDSWEQAWAITEHLLAGLRDEVAANDAQLVTVIVPPHMIVEYDTWSWKGAFEQRAQSLDLWYPHTRMLSLLSDLGIPTLDPLQTFLEFRRATGKSPFYLHDRHFNATGTCLFGMSVSEWLIDEGYVEQRTDTARDPIETCAGA